MVHILDTVMLTGFVLFLIYIFRGYHLSRLDTLEKEDPVSDEDNSPSR